MGIDPAKGENYQPHTNEERAMNLREAFILRVAIAEPVDYGSTPWGPRTLIGAGAGRLEGDRLRADIVPNPWW